MKRLFIPLSFLLISFHSFSQVPTTGLLGYWPFDGDIKSKINSYMDAQNATTGKVLFSTDRNNKPNSAFLYDSTYLTVPYNGFCCNPERTFTLWIYYPSSCCHFGDVFGQGTATSGNWSTSMVYGLALFDSPDYYVNPGTKFGPKEMTEGWHHFAYVYKNNQIKLWLDGQVDSVFSASIALSQNGLLIAKMRGQKGGKLDELAFYDRAWSDQEVLSYYAGIVTSTSIDQQPSTSSLRVIPNPALQGSFQVQSDTPIEKLEIYDMTGKPLTSVSGNRVEDSRVVFTSSKESARQKRKG